MIESRTNGPCSCAVFQTAIEHTRESPSPRRAGPAAAPPRAAPGRRRTARRAAAPAPPAPPAGEHNPALHERPAGESRSTRGRPGQQSRREYEHARRIAQGPGPKTRPRSFVPITSPRRSDVGPNAALTRAATTAQRTSANTSNVRASCAASASQFPQQQRGDHQGERVADRLAHDGSQRRREIREQQIPDARCPATGGRRIGRARRDPRPQAATPPQPHHRDMRARGPAVRPGSTHRRPARPSSRTARRGRAGCRGGRRSFLRSGGGRRRCR